MTPDLHTIVRRITREQLHPDTATILRRRCTSGAATCGPFLRLLPDCLILRLF
jgi:hypothetical protein